MGSAKPLKSFLYLFGYDGGEGPSKIGYTHDVDNRLEQIMAQSRRKLILTGSWPVGTRIALAAERYVHWKLRAKHFKGEWFNVSYEEMQAAVAEALAHPLDPHELVPSLEKRGKPIRYGEHIPNTFVAGTKDRMDAVLGPDEARNDLVREAVERELQRREALATLNPPSPSKEEG